MLIHLLIRHLRAVQPFPDNPDSRPTKRPRAPLINLNETDYPSFDHIRRFIVAMSLKCLLIQPE